MVQQSLANKGSEPDRDGLIVVGGAGGFISGVSRESARWIRSPCPSGTSVCRAWRAYAWI